MKLSHIALAALAVATSSAAFADTARLAGASASAVNVVRGLKNICSGTFNVNIQSAATNSLGNVFTATCSANFGTTTVDQVRVNVAGGSLSAVTSTTGQTGATSVSLINPAAATCTALGAGTGPLSFLVAGELKNCTTTGTVSETVDGGFMDVDGTIFRANGLTIPASVDDSTDYKASAFYQAFGVGVSPTLYAALQAYQVAQGLLPASCATVAGTVFTAGGSVLPDCQPSISRAQLASLMVTGSNVAKQAGANSLLGGTATVKNDLVGKSISPDVALKTKITYCRRPNTSGTQASAQLYFLNSPTGSGEVGGSLAVVGSNDAAVAPATSVLVNIGTAFTADTRTSTSNVKSCLNTATGHAVGIVSAENNPIGGSDVYRFVKLNGVSVTEGTSAASNTVEAIAGRYDFAYNTAMFCPAGVCTPILDELNKSTTIVAGQSSPGLYLTTEAKFTRSQGKSTRPFTSK